MGTSVVRFIQASDIPAWGVLQNGAIHALATNYQHHAELVAHYFGDPQAFRSSISSEPTAKMGLLSPISPNTQLFAQGLNYAEHREESGLDEAARENLIFAKPPSSICGPNDDIQKPATVDLLDYEIELGLVMKQAITTQISVTDENLSDYVGALVLCNDVSARDEMFGAPMLQWFKGKGYRTFCPTGPILYLMDPDDFNNLYNLELTLKLNGVVKQKARTAQLIHKPPKTISEISAFADLQTGDVILTGTPGGVLAGHSVKTGLAIMMNLTNDQKRRAKFIAAQRALATFLQSGDQLDLSIRSSDGTLSLGTQSNKVVNA